MTLLGRAVSGLIEKRAAPPGSPWGDSTPPTNGSLVNTAAGTVVTDRSALGIAAVWACVAVIADGVATLPVRQYRGTGPDRVEVDPSPVIAEPCSEFHQIDFLGTGTGSLALRGNFFARVASRDRQSYPTQLVPLSPDQVRVRRDKQSGQIEYRVAGDVVPVDDMFHIPNLMRPGAVVGMNPIEELRVTLGLAQAAQEYGAAFFANSAHASGFLVSEEDLTPEETLNLAREWMSMHQGINNAHLPAVLTGGLSWHQISIAPDDAQFIQTRDLSTTEVTMIFRVPPHLISVVDKSTSWGAGIEQQELGWVRGGLAGYIRRWEVAMSSLVPEDEHVEFDLRRRLRGDSVQRSAVITNLRNAGVINADEARVLYEDLPPIPDGQGETYLQPLNMGDAGNPVGVPAPKGSSSAPPPGEVRISPVIHNHLPAQAQPVVNVSQPRAPIVNVAAPAVRVEPKVHVDAPVVHNHLPEPRAIRRKVKRDEETGLITEITEE